MRSREIDHENIILDKDYIRKQLVPRLQRTFVNIHCKKFRKGTWACHQFFKERIAVEEATEEDKKYLDLKGYTHVVVAKKSCLFR